MRNARENEANSLVTLAARADTLKSGFIEQVQSGCRGGGV